MHVTLNVWHSAFKARNFEVFNWEKTWKGLQPKLDFVLFCIVLFSHIMHTTVIEVYFQIKRLHIYLAPKKKKKKNVMDICVQLKISLFITNYLFHLISNYYNNYAIVCIFYHLNLCKFNKNLYVIATIIHIITLIYVQHFS